jgi:hypothetical protein
MDTETELIRKLVFTGHLNVPERKALPSRTAKLSLLHRAMVEALQSGESFQAWWVPDDSMIGCQVMYRGDGPSRVCWTYDGIEGQRNGVTQYDSYKQAAETLIQDIRKCWGDAIDGVPIDLNA